MSNIFLFLASIILAVAFIIMTISGTIDLTRDAICKQSYTAKVSQQIPTCKQWEDNINNMKEGK